MSNITFVAGVTPVPATWLNDVNNTVYNVLGNGTSAPTSLANIAAAIGTVSFATQYNLDVTPVSVISQSYLGGFFTRQGPTAAAMSVAAPNTFTGNGNAFVIANQSPSTGVIVLSINGGTLYIYPGQTMMFLALNGQNKWGIIGQGRYRASNIQLYVDSAFGSDTTGDGLGATSRAFATIAKAVNILYQNMDLNGTAATINIASATYSVAQVFQGAPVGYNQIILSGTSVLWQAPGTSTTCITATDNVRVTLQGTITFNSNSNNACTAILSQENAVVEVSSNNITFGAFPSGYHMYASTGGTINVNSNYTISGGCTFHQIAGTDGRITHVAGVGVTITGTPALTTFYETIGAGSSILLGTGMSWSGAITAGCQKWFAVALGVFQASGNAASIPGTVAGVPAVGTGAGASPYGLATA